MQFLRSNCFLLAFFVASGLAWAGPFEDGVEAVNSGDFQKAFRLWSPLADGGDASAQYNLGLMYDDGDGTPEDEQQACYCYRKAADQGDAGAQFT